MYGIKVTAVKLRTRICLKSFFFTSKNSYPFFMVFFFFFFFFFFFLFPASSSSLDTTMQNQRIQPDGFLCLPYLVQILPFTLSPPPPPPPPSRCMFFHPNLPLVNLLVSSIARSCNRAEKRNTTSHYNDTN